MNNEDKMLQLVLSDKNLSSFYEFNADDFPTIKDAMRSDKPVVVAVAKIISGIARKSEKSIQKEIYTEVFNYLNQNML
jgi:hypothetical protein